MSWNLSVWRGPEELYEDWLPLDVAAVAEAVEALPGLERADDDRWQWDGPSGGISAELTLFTPEVDEPVNELAVSVIFEPGDLLRKRTDLRLLGDAVFEAARRTGATVGELGYERFVNVDAFVARGLWVDPWRGDLPPPRPRDEVTRRELFGRLLRRD